MSNQGRIFRTALRPSTSSAYVFIMLTLVFGLPLLTAYYNVDPSFYFKVLIPYLCVTISLFLVFIILGSSASYLEGNTSTSGISRSRGNKQSTFMKKFNSTPRLLPASLVIASAVSFLAAVYLVGEIYPYVPPQATINSLGVLYVISLVAASILVFSRIIYRAFPVLSEILKSRKYSLLAVSLSVGFAFVYFILVNQIIISGYNVQGTAPSYGGYPSWFAMTPAVNNLMIYFVYLPTLIVQISPAVNLIIIPFEMVFATLLTLLVASNVVMAHYLISHSGLACSTKGAVLSTGGSILGLSATCPTCLVPTFVSVAFGGVSAAVLTFSSFYGVVLPPLISVAALVLSAVYLQREIRKRTSMNPRAFTPL